VGVDITSEDEVPVQGLDVNAVLGKMDAARNRMNLLILDACRNNPFARSFRSANRGLTQMDAPRGTFVAFATAPGSTASDGGGQNGLYTHHILKVLGQPGLKVEEVFKKVRIGVQRDSRDQQVPWDSSSLTGDFYFREGGASEVRTATDSASNQPTLLVGAPTDATAVPPPPLPLTGNLQVSVTGAEAKVFLDGALKGMAKPDQPLNLTGLPAGESKLKLEAPGYLPIQQTVRIEAGKWNQVGHPLKEGMKIVVYIKQNLFSPHFTFDLLVDQRKVAVMSDRAYARVELPIGPHSIKLRTQLTPDPKKPQDWGETDIVKLIDINNKTCYVRFVLRMNGVNGTGAVVTEETWKNDLSRDGYKQAEVLE
jgi:hypothetical protein